MRFPYVGIVSGFRILSGNSKISDLGQLDVLQVGTKDFPSVLKFIYIENPELTIECLNNFKNGQLKWISCIVKELTLGKNEELVLQELLTVEDIDF